MDVIQLLNRAPSPLDARLLDDDDEDLPELFMSGEWLGIFDRSGKLLLAANLVDVFTANGEKVS